MNRYDYNKHHSLFPPLWQEALKRAAHDPVQLNNVIDAMVVGGMCAPRAKAPELIPPTTGN